MIHTHNLNSWDSDWVSRAQKALKRETELRQTPPRKRDQKGAFGKGVGVGTGEDW